MVGVRLAKTRGVAACVINMITYIISQLTPFLRGFETSAVTRSNIYIPPGLVDMVITLTRGNYIKAYCIVITIAMCAFSRYYYSLRHLFFYFRVDHNHFDVGDHRYCVFQLQTKGRSARCSCRNIVCFHPVEEQYAWCS